MKRSIEWQNTRNANYINIHKRVSNVSPGIVSKLGYNESDRGIIGFSDDRQLLYIKKSDSGTWEHLSKSNNCPACDILWKDWRWVRDKNDKLS